jgi:hypothetical protein
LVYRLKCQLILHCRTFLSPEDWLIAWWSWELAEDFHRHGQFGEAQRLIATAQQQILWVSGLWVALDASLLSARSDGPRAGGSRGNAGDNTAAVHVYTYRGSTVC